MDGEMAGWGGWRDRNSTMWFSVACDRRKPFSSRTLGDFPTKSLGSSSALYPPEQRADSGTPPQEHWKEGKERGRQERRGNVKLFVHGTFIKIMTM